MRDENCKDPGMISAQITIYNKVCIPNLQIVQANCIN